MAPAPLKLMKNKKTGQRYILYKGKKYIFKSAAPDSTIYKNLFSIIHTLLERRKRKRKATPKYQASTGNTLTTGFATVDDKLLEKIKSLNDTHLLENLKKEQLLLKNVKKDVIEERKLLKHQKQLLLHDAPAQNQNPAPAPNKKLVGVVKYSEMKISDLEKEGSALKDNIDLMKQEASQLKSVNDSMKQNNSLLEDNLIKREIEAINMDNRIRDAKWKEFLLHPSHSKLVTLHGKILSSSSKTSTNSGKKSKEDLIDEIDNEIGRQDLRNHILASLDQGMSPDEIIDSFDHGQSGDGLVNGEGLYNTEVAQLMKKYGKKGFQGVFSIDQLDQINPNGRKEISFILNIVPSTVKIGHFVSIIINSNRNILEYYDSLAYTPSKMFIKEIKQVLNKMGMKPSKTQLKINLLRSQRANSSNCGFFAIQFLLKRFKGETFKDASGFSKFIGILESERKIKMFKKHIKQFQTVEDFNV